MTDSPEDSSRADAAPPEPPRRFGASTFTIEGRAAPGLFVAGWLATILGLGGSIVAYLGQQPVVAIIGLVVLAVGLIALGGSQAIERRARGIEPYHGPSPLLVFAASIPVFLVAILLLGTIVRGLSIPVSGPAGDLVTIAVQTLAYLAVVRLVVVGTRSLSWREMGFRPGLSEAVQDLGWGAVFAGPVIVATFIVQAVLIAIFQVAPESPLPPTGQPSGLLLNLISGAVLAPIGEETIFRGVATTAWVRSLGLTPGIVRAAIFFAAAHILGIMSTSFATGAALAIVAFAARIPVALTLGWVFTRRRSIYASMGLHATFNGILIVLSEIATRSSVGAG